jgi:hypothetical protein
MHYSIYNHHTINVILGKVREGEEFGEANQEDDEG